MNCSQFTTANFYNFFKNDYLEKVYVLSEYQITEQEYNNGGRWDDEDCFKSSKYRSTLTLKEHKNILKKAKEFNFIHRMMCLPANAKLNHNKICS